MTKDRPRSLSDMVAGLVLRTSVFLAELNYWKVAAWVAGIWILSTLALLVYVSPETRDQRDADELLLLGAEAERTARQVMQAFEPCKKLGFGSLAECSASTSPLPSEQGYAKSADAAIQRLTAYYDRCYSSYSKEYCEQLLNRAAAAINAGKSAPR